MRTRREHPRRLPWIRFDPGAGSLGGADDRVPPGIDNGCRADNCRVHRYCGIPCKDNKALGECPAEQMTTVAAGDCVPAGFTSYTERTFFMNEAPDFLSSAQNQVVAARLLGAVFNPDGTWTMNAGQKPLPSELTDRLRVHRRAIAALQIDHR